MKLKTKILIIIFALMSLSGFSQTNPKITLTGTNTQATIYKGAVGANTAMLLPEGTHEEIYPDLPKKGRIQLNSNTNKLEVHNGTEWVEVGSGGATGNLTADQVFENGSYVAVRESVNIMGGNDGFGGGSINLRGNAAELHSPNFQYHILTTDTGCSFGSYNGTQRGSLFANKDVVQAETYITNYPYTRIGWDLDRATNQFRVKTNGLPVVTFGTYGAKYDTTYVTYNFDSDPNMIPSAGWVKQKIENILTSIQTGVDNYASDLSSEFTDNSKVSKKYVDDAIDKTLGETKSGEMDIYSYPDSLSFAKIKVKPYYDEDEGNYQPGYFQYNTHHKLDDVNTTDTYLDIQWDRIRLGHSSNYNDGEYSSSLSQEIDFNDENLHFEFANSESGIYQNMSVDGYWSISGYQSGGSYGIGVERQISGDYANFRFPAPLNGANYYLPIKVNGQLADSHGEIDLTNSINAAVDKSMIATYNLLEDADLASLSIAVNTYISYLPSTESSRKLKLLGIGANQGKRISIFNMSAHDLRLETAKGADDIWNSGTSSSFFIVPPGANIVLLETGNKLAVETFKTSK